MSLTRTNGWREREQKAPVFAFRSSRTSVLHTEEHINFILKSSATLTNAIALWLRCFWVPVTEAKDLQVGPQMKTWLSPGTHLCLYLHSVSLPGLFLHLESKMLRFPTWVKGGWQAHASVLAQQREGEGWFFLSPVRVRSAGKNILPPYNCWNYLHNIPKIACTIFRAFSWTVYNLYFIILRKLSLINPKKKMKMLFIFKSDEKYQKPYSFSKELAESWDHFSQEGETGKTAPQRPSLPLIPVSTGTADLGDLVCR